MITRRVLIQVQCTPTPLGTYFNPASAQISLKRRTKYRYILPIWNVILSILRYQNHFHGTKLHLGYQNWQHYISNGCVLPLFKWVQFSDGMKKNYLCPNTVLILAFWGNLITTLTNIFTLYCTIFPFVAYCETAVATKIVRFG